MIHTPNLFNYAVFLNHTAMRLFPRMLARCDSFNWAIRVSQKIFSQPSIEPTRCTH
jgi:hypothetical protein